jgi:hypothetical protein
MENPEKDLAYLYLSNKGFITVEKQGQQNHYMRPTVHGIDTVEN